MEQTKMELKNIQRLAKTDIATLLNYSYDELKNFKKADILYMVNNKLTPKEMMDYKINLVIEKKQQQQKQKRKCLKSLLSDEQKKQNKKEAQFNYSKSEAGKLALKKAQEKYNTNIKLKLLQLSKLSTINYDKILILVDGNYFKPFTEIKTIKYKMIEGGDNKYTSIAAASILAKTERDKYIDELCEKNPILVEHYGIDSNKGYGAKRHMDGIKEHGITIWHRRSFGICKNYV